ncbi:GNAT family N-acetyltransferase [Clostridium sp. D2Q-11]|uniref:GNAT family N-acetyltransferase n=1 Tax=Anaeromonas frigoriresistens TaxID=2683708 RepID=A0A942V1A8_9FIRM|nr:GNAT family N-acetyltransferase [Anaeromonas frigoriresistens]MBS4539352.1 GNAT family N-acetyltransferase [Anaeromonas frigoriresistens]
MNLEFRKPTEQDGSDIATWKYEGEYSFYDNDKTETKNEWARNIHNEENAYVIYNENNELIGNCSFDLEDGEYMFGVQMRPDLTGKGKGTEIVKTILDFGKKTYDFNTLVLLVAKFNQRAIRIYEKLDFEIIEEFVWNVNDEQKEFIAMRKTY